MAREVVEQNRLGLQHGRAGARAGSSATERNTHAHAHAHAHAHVHAHVHVHVHVGRALWAYGLAARLPRHSSPLHDGLGRLGEQAPSPPPPPLELPSLLRLHSSSASATCCSATAYDRARAGAGATLKARNMARDKPLQENGNDGERFRCVKQLVRRGAPCTACTTRSRAPMERTPSSLSLASRAARPSTCSIVA
eukprot:scaffold10717_cov61-Phaeocystis_antarctica.AAC.9